VQGLWLEVELHTFQVEHGRVLPTAHNKFTDGFIFLKSLGPANPRRVLYLTPQGNGGSQSSLRVIVARDCELTGMGSGLDALCAVRRPEIAGMGSGFYIL